MTVNILIFLYYIHMFLQLFVEIKRMFLKHFM